MFLVLTHKITASETGDPDYPCLKHTNVANSTINQGLNDSMNSLNFFFFN